MKYSVLALMTFLLLTFGSTAVAESYSTGFESTESFTLGGINLRPGGDVLWFENSSQLGSGSIDQEIQSTYVRTGTQAFRISNAKGNQQAHQMAGVQLFEAAGEAGAMTSGSISTTGFGPENNQHGENNTTPVQTAATQNRVVVSYWWRTVSTSSNSDFNIQTNIADLGGRRMTYLKYFADADDSGALKAQCYGTTYDDTVTDGFSWISDISDSLQWGQWYETTEELIFTDPVGGVAVDDIVRYTIRDGSGATVYAAETPSWEAPYHLGAYAPAETIQGVDTWSIKAGNESDIPAQVGLGLVIDDFSMATVPEPATMSLLTLGGWMAACCRRRRPC